MSSKLVTMAEAAAAGAAPLLCGLPDEIVIWEILVRLDPKSLLRCRAVCRAWRCATSTRSFLLAHHSHQPALPIFTGDQYILDVMYRHILTFDHQAASRTQLRSVARFAKPFDLEASCDGLLVLSKVEVTGSRAGLYIINLATREHASLLPPWYFKNWYFKTMGMYAHRPTGEYRLLLQRRSFRGSYKDQTGCYILALGSGQPPRHIAWPETPSTYPAVYYSLPVWVRDSLHWYLKHSPSDNKLIIVFDTIDESFRQMRAPIFPTNSYIFEMDGTLGIYSHNNATGIVDIWVLHNYETQVWKFKYRIELPVAEIRGNFEGCDGYWEVDVVSVDGGVVLLVSVGRWLLHVGSGGKLIASFHRGHQSHCMSGSRLKQSLVQHTFFPALEGYAVSASPFF